MLRRWSPTQTVAVVALVGLLGCSLADAKPNSDQAGLRQADPITLVVMDPLAAPLSCPCVDGYAQRDYEQLAAALEKLAKRRVVLVFHESLTTALREKTEGRVDLVIGKDSVVRSDAAKADLRLQAVASLTGKQGLTTQTGLIVVPRDDPARQVEDLEGYQVLLGPADSDEKHHAARRLLKQAGVTLPEEIETSNACSDGACKVLELAEDNVRAAAVISSYAQPLLEGCGTIQAGDLRVVAETAPVPFITAFVNSELPQATQDLLRDWLLTASEDQTLCKALESLLGFVPAADEERSAKKKRTATQTAARP